MLIGFIFFNGCGVKSPTNYSFFDVRSFKDGTDKYAEFVGEFDLKDEDITVKTPELSELSSTQFGDLFYQVSSGETQRFFIKTNQNSVFSWESLDQTPKKLNLTRSYPFGLVIGQSKEYVYFYNSPSKGRDFCKYSTLTGESDLIQLIDYRIIQLIELPLSTPKYLTCGVKQKGESQVLGFHLMSSDGNIVETLHSIPLDYEPNGDPSLYGGGFYQYNDKVIFMFDNRSGIFVFDETGVFLKEINTVDKFNFMHKSNDNYSPIFEGLYKEAIFLDNHIFIRTNILSSKNKYILFDSYSLSNGEYEGSFRVYFKDLDLDKYSTPIWTHWEEEEFVFLFGTGYKSGEYSKFKIVF